VQLCDYLMQSAAYMGAANVKNRGNEISVYTTLQWYWILTLVGKDVLLNRNYSSPSINQMGTAVSESLKKGDLQHFKIVKMGIDVIPTFICIKQYEDVKLTTVFKKNPLLRMANDHHSYFQTSKSKTCELRCGEALAQTERKCQLN